MFEKINKRPFYRKMHLTAPLLNERIEYLEYLERCGYPLSSIKDAANYLLRIVELLNLTTKRTITRQEIEDGVIAWAQHQYNHPQKKNSFSKTSEERFIRCVTNWFKKLNWLEPPPKKTSIFYEIFERSYALKRHLSAPLLEERLMYLHYWKENGAVMHTLQGIAQYQLVIMKYLKFYKIRKIYVAEINKAANRWAKASKDRLKKNIDSNYARKKFIRDAKCWFKMLGCLEDPPKKTVPYQKYLDAFLIYMEQEQGLSCNTIYSRRHVLQNFLTLVRVRVKSLKKLTPLVVDNILIEKHDINGYSRRSVQAYASIIRSFLRYAENQSWCQNNLADSIKAPRVYRNESLPYSPSWEDVGKILKSYSNEHPTDVRNRAIIMLLAVYGLRCSEVTNLKLEDIDWKKKTIYLRRAKGSKPRIFPLVETVGNAILKYLKNVRQNNCLLKEVFLCVRSPYRSMSTTAIYAIVSAKLRKINPNLKHHGPHALRHACATHLINNGASLKEICDHLGHKGIEATRIYAKVDLVSLRKVAEINFGGLL